jgi:AcrR family transcriptional regulator
MSTSKDAGKRRRAVTTYHHGDLPAALVAAGREAVHRHGWHGLAVRELARALRVSHAAAYRHFPSRDALLAAIAAACMLELAQALEMAEEAAKGETALGCLLRIADTYIAFALHHPREFDLMFSTAVAGASAYPQLRAANDRASAPVRRLVDLIYGTRASQAVRAARCLQLWALVHGFATLTTQRQFEEGPLHVSSTVDSRTAGVLGLTRDAILAVIADAD